MNTWSLRHTDVIISVTGTAAGDIQFNDTQRHVFTTGMERVIRETNAWVVTGGTNGGVMKMVIALRRARDSLRRTRDCMHLHAPSCAFHANACKPLSPSCLWVWVFSGWPVDD